MEIGSGFLFHTSDNVSGVKEVLQSRILIKGIHAMSLLHRVIRSERMRGRGAKRRRAVEEERLLESRRLVVHYFIKHFDFECTFAVLAFTISHPVCFRESSETCF